MMTVRTKRISAKDQQFVEREINEFNSVRMTVAEFRTIRFIFFSNFNFKFVVVPEFFITNYRDEVVNLINENLKREISG